MKGIRYFVVSTIGFFGGAACSLALILPPEPKNEPCDPRLTQRQLEKATELWQSKQDSDAAFAIAEHFRTHCHQRDRKTEGEWRRRAAAGGDIGMIRDLALHLTSSEDLDDISESVLLLRRLVEAGDGDAVRDLSEAQHRLTSKLNEDDIS